MTIRFVALIVLTLMAILAACSSSPNENNPDVAVVVTYYEAINAYDVDTAVALFHEDAVCHLRGKIYTGRDEIRSHLESIVEKQVDFRINNFEVKGDKVVWYTKAIGDGLWMSYEVVVQDGKIKSLAIRT